MNENKIYQMNFRTMEPRKPHQCFPFESSFCNRNRTLLLSIEMQLDMQHFTYSSAMILNSCWIFACRSSFISIVIFFILFILQKQQKKSTIFFGVVEIEVSVNSDDFNFVPSNVKIDRSFWRNSHIRHCFSVQSLFLLHNNPNEKKKILKSKNT